MSIVLGLDGEELIMNTTFVKVVAFLKSAVKVRYIMMSESV